MSKFKVGDRVRVIGTKLDEKEVTINALIETDRYALDVDGNTGIYSRHESELELVQSKPQFDLSKCPRNAEGHWLCQTREGKKITIVSNNFPFGSYSLVGTWEGHNQNYAPLWTSEGVFNVQESSKYDLFNLPQKIEGWVCMFRRKNGSYLFSDLLTDEQQIKDNKALFNHLATLVAVLPQSITLGDGLTNSERSKL